MDEKRKKKIQDAILTSLLLALIGHAYKIDADVRELRVKEPLTKDDIIKVTKSIDEVKGNIRDMNNTFQRFLIQYATEDRR